MGFAMSLSDHDKRRLALAEWYAREALMHDAMREHAAADEALQTASEYLSALYGRAIRATSASDVIALCCAYTDSPALEAVAK